MWHDVELRELLIFLVLADELHFGRTAERLGISQPGVSEAVRVLESRLGVKVFAGQTVTGGEIIVRQRGTRFKPGAGVGIGKDDTLYARAAGTVQFNSGWRGRVVSVLPDGDQA